VSVPLIVMSLAMLAARSSALPVWTFPLNTIGRARLPAALLNHWATRCGRC
jgi:hypothetical protein